MQLLKCDDGLFNVKISLLINIENCCCLKNRAQENRVVTTGFTACKTA